MFNTGEMEMIKSLIISVMSYNHANMATKSSSTQELETVTNQPMKVIDIPNEAEAE